VAGAVCWSSRCRRRSSWISQKGRDLLASFLPPLGEPLLLAELGWLHVATGAAAAAGPLVEGAVAAGAVAAGAVASGAAAGAHVRVVGVCVVGA
jgi:hypothetical protein